MKFPNKVKIFQRLNRTHLSEKFSSNRLVGHFFKHRIPPHVIREEEIYEKPEELLNDTPAEIVSFLVGRC